MCILNDIYLTITKGAHAMLYVPKLPQNLWSVVVKTMAYLRNRSPTQANNGVMPLEHITGEKPDLTHLKIFGSPVSIMVPKENIKSKTIGGHAWVIL